MRRVLTSLLLAASLGCASSGAPSRTQEVRASSGHGYALLYGMLGQERQVSSLLLSQNEALTYMVHLADTLSRSEPNPTRLAFVRELWKELTLLQEDVLALVRRPAPMRGS